MAQLNLSPTPKRVLAAHDELTEQSAKAPRTVDTSRSDVSHQSHSQLPIELVAVIMCLLSRNSLKSAIQVCKLWHEAFRHECVQQAVLVQMYCGKRVLDSLTPTWAEVLQLNTRAQDAEDQLIGRGRFTRNGQVATAALDECAKLGHPRAMLIIGDALYWGEGDLPDFADGNAPESLRATHFINAAADAGDVVADFLRLHQGIGVTADRERAREVLIQHGNRSDYLVQTWLSTLYSDEPDVAARYMQQAADAGYAPAQCEIGYCYEFGIGVAVDLRMAERYYELSIQEKYLEAEKRLRRLQKLLHSHNDAAQRGKSLHNGTGIGSCADDMSESDPESDEDLSIECDQSCQDICCAHLHQAAAASTAS